MRRSLRWGLRIGALLAVAGVAGFLLALSGIISLKASAGHWGITEAILQFGKERSIATHTLGMSVPPLDDPALVLRGAGHYEGGCRPCHGSPELRHPRIAAAMLPPPPYLPDIVDEWEPEELFYIVKHGIKFTGMPAWPALERDDEVWAVVAFLRVMPELDVEGYRRLVFGDEPGDGAVLPLEGLPDPPPVPRAVTESCARCHGADGLGRGNAAFPKLAGQKHAYLLASLDAYAEGRRHSGIMEPIAAGLEPEERRALAAYYSRMDPGLGAAPRAGVARGEPIVREGVPASGIPSCMDCHGPGAHRRNPTYPELAGQYEDYLVLQLELFRKGARGGTRYAHIMHEVADDLTAEQIRDVAAYYASFAAVEGVAER